MKALYWLDSRAAIQRVPGPRTSPCSSMSLSGLLWKRGLFSFFLHRSIWIKRNKNTSTTLNSHGSGSLEVCHPPAALAEWKIKCVIGVRQGPDVKDLRTAWTNRVNACKCCGIYAGDNLPFMCCSQDAHSNCVSWWKREVADTSGLSVGLIRPLVAET